MEDQWKPGIIVYMPGTAYGGTAQNAYKPYWQRIKSTKWIEGEGCNGSGGWLEITFESGHTSSPYWLRRCDATLPGEPGYCVPARMQRETT